MSDEIRNIRIGDRIESYARYTPDGWAKTAFAAARTGSVRDALTTDLMIAWRTTADAASMSGCPEGHAGGRVRVCAAYRKFGFEDVGAHAFRLGADVQTDRIMVRSLGPK